MVNRIQKLRKKAGLVASDAVDVFLDLPDQASQGAGPEGPARLRQIVEAQVRSPAIRCCIFIMILAVGC